MLVTVKMRAKYDIRIIVGKVQSMLVDVDSNRYSFSKLLSDVSAFVEKSAGDNLCFSMVAYVEDSFDTVEIIDDNSLKMMFARNKVRKEIDLHISITDVEPVPLAIDMSFAKKQVLDDLDVEYEPPSGKVVPEFTSVRRKLFRSCKPKPPSPPRGNHPKEPHAFVDLTEDDDPPPMTQPTQQEPETQSPPTATQSPPPEATQSPPPVTPYIPQPMQDTPMKPVHKDLPVNDDEFEELLSSILRRNQVGLENNEGVDGKQQQTSVRCIRRS